MIQSAASLQSKCGLKKWIKNYFVCLRKHGFRSSKKLPFCWAKVWAVVPALFLRSIWAPLFMSISTISLWSVGIKFKIKVFHFNTAYFNRYLLKKAANISGVFPLLLLTFTSTSFSIKALTTFVWPKVRPKAFCQF